MEQEYIVVGQHEFEGVLVELVVWKDDLEVIHQGASQVFWSQARVRLSKIEADRDAVVVR